MFSSPKSTAPEPEATELVGIPPEIGGESADVISFLTQFRVFMLLNRNSQITKDPILRAAYFLNTLRYPRHDVREWVKRKSEWLLQVERFPMLHRGTNACKVLEADFETSFGDTAGSN
jgi:hypothetical protein